MGKDVLELGAGAGLPGLVCGILGARKVRDGDIYPLYGAGWEGRGGADMREKERGK